MTIKEALSTKTSALKLSSAELDLALLEAGLDGASAYDPSTQAKEVDMVWAGFLLTTIQVTEVKEDDVSIKYSTDLKGIYSSIMRKYGLVDPFAIAKPKVTQKFIW
jgi:hypothetical protein